jgi:hypothetical protein
MIFRWKKYLLPECLEASVRQWQSIVEVLARNQISQVCTAYVLYADYALENTTQHERSNFLMLICIKPILGPFTTSSRTATRFGNEATLRIFLDCDAYYSIEDGIALA